MAIEPNSRPTTMVTFADDRLHVQTGQFVPVAIPNNLDQSKNLKADLEARDIPVLLDVQEAEMDEEKLGGVPVLVPEGNFELASEIVDFLELNALEDDDKDLGEDEDEEFEEVEADDEEEEEEEDEDDWDEDELEDEEEDEEEEEEEEEEEAEEFDAGDTDEEEEEEEDEDEEPDEDE